MKIIYIITSVCNSSGDNRVLTVKMNYLAEQAGYDVILVTADQNGRKPFFELSSKIKHLDLGINYNEIPCYSHFFLRFRIPIKTSRFRQALKYHERKLGEIISIEKPDVMVSVNNGVQNFFVGKMKRSFPIIFEYHCALHKERDSALIWGDNWKKRILGWCRTRRLLRVSRQYDRVVVLTKEDKTLWEKHNDNIVQIYNPLPFESGEVSKLDKKKLISVGRLTPQKNYGSLIAAWKIVQSKHPDWIIDVWGEGPSKRQLESLILENGIQNTFFLRGVTKNIKAEYLGSSGYVMSSKYEGCPMVLLEASTCGLPLISYACECGPRDIIEDGKNGILVPVDDVNGLVNAICRVIEDEDLRKEMGRQAKIMSTRFSAEKILPQWTVLFENL